MNKKMTTNDLINKFLRNFECQSVLSAFDSSLRSMNIEYKVNEIHHDKAIYSTNKQFYTEATNVGMAKPILPNTFDKPMKIT